MKLPVTAKRKEHLCHGAAAALGFLSAVLLSLGLLCGYWHLFTVGAVAYIVACYLASKIYGSDNESESEVKK